MAPVICYLSTSLYLVCLAKGFSPLTCFHFKIKLTSNFLLVLQDDVVAWQFLQFHSYFEYEEIILKLYLTLYCSCIEMLNFCSFLHKTDTIEKEIRKIFNIPGEKETRLWNKYMSNTFEPLNKPDSTIQDAGLYQGQVQWNVISFLEYIYLLLTKM